MLNPTAWNWVGKAGFFFGGLSVLCLVWTYFRLPETGSRTYEELDILQRQVDTGEFGGYVICYSPFENTAIHEWTTIRQRRSHS
jgi:SP family general alpha glucoside:H+ symporter-like MFS transporter